MKYYEIDDVFAGVEWKVIDDFPNYAVSADGRVYSFNSKRVLKPEVVHNGYLRVNLCLNGKAKHRRIHVLVAEAFLEQPEGCVQVHHKNHNVADNRVENLEWMSEESHR